MKSRYVTFILRMRLDARSISPSDSLAFHGSIQQAGQERTHYFASFDKFLTVLRETVDQAIPLPAGSREDPWKE